MPNIVFLVVDSGATWQFNRRFYELTGLNPAEEDGFFPRVVTHEDDIATHDVQWVNAFQNHLPLIGEVRVRADDGEY